MSRVNRDLEVSLAEWEPGNVGSVFNRQAIRSRDNYPPAAPMSSPRLAKRGNLQMTLIFADEKSVLIGEICG